MTVNFSKLTLVVEFLVMAAVLIARPYGLLGRPQGVVRTIAEPDAPLRPATASRKVLGLGVLVLLVALPLLTRGAPYALVLAVDVLIAVPFCDQPAFHRWSLAACIRSDTPPISGSGPMAPACW